MSFWIQKQIFVTTVKAAGSNNNSLDLDMIKVIVDRAFLNTATLAGGKWHAPGWISDCMIGMLFFGRTQSGERIAKKKAFDTHEDAAPMSAGL